MFEGHRVVTVTPAGRRRHVEVLAAYLLREKGLIDEHQWWVNTDDAQDQAYLHQISQQHPDFFQILESPAPCPPAGLSRNARLAYFYPTCVDQETVYIKLDDDICFLAPNALRQLVEFRLRYPQYFLVHANTVNSPLNTSIHQRIGAVQWRAMVEYDPFGNGWRDGELAMAIHEAFLAAIENAQTARWCFPRWEIPRPERFAINCCAWFGSDFQPFASWYGDDDEGRFTLELPKVLSRSNVVCGTALVAHFSFATQARFLEQTDLQERYARYAPPESC